MKRTLVRRFGAILALLTVAQVIALPAAIAAPPVGTASIAAAQRTVLAGQAGAVFDITVTNGSLIERQGAGNYVQIIPPTEEGYTIASLTAPAGWTTKIANGVAIFKAAADATPQQLLLPTRSLTFSVTANVARPLIDTASTWAVSTSTNNGTILNPANPSTAGALDSTARVLKVISVSMIGVTEVIDGNVTSGQTATLRAEIQNAGDGSLLVTPALSGLGNATFTGGAPAVVGRISSAFFDFDVTFGSAGTVTPSVDASAPGADGQPASGSAIVVQTAAAFTYKNNTLTPTAVVPGQDYTFEVALDKTGQVAADITSATFTIGTQSTTLAAPQSFAGGTASQTLTFNPLALTVPDGVYTPTLTIGGSDSNGFPVATAVTIGQTVTIDGSLPISLPVITPPASQVAGEPAAITNGSQLSFSGSAYLADGVTKCTNCTVSNAFLRQFAGTTELVTIPVDVSISNGDYSGSYSGNYDPAATLTRLVVEARKVTGTTGPGNSDTVEVDNLAPTIVTAVTGGGTSNKRLIVVNLSEGIVGGPLGMSPADWTVDNNTVQDATISGGTIQLTLGQDLQGDSKPRVAYAPTPATRGNDRVGIDLENQDLQALDGIVPDQPTFNTIANNGPQGGQFYTNDGSPDIVLGSVAPGQTVTLYADDGNGVFDGSDSAIGDALVQSGNTATITPEFGSVDRTVLLFARTEDGSNNLSTVADETLNLDFTPAGTVAAVVDGSDISVEFSETIASGRDFAADWFVYGQDALGRSRKFPAEVVAVGGDLNEIRTVSVSHPDFTGDVDKIEYFFTGDDPDVDRYRDRAGNMVSDFILILP